LIWQKLTREMAVLTLFPFVVGGSPPIGRSGTCSPALSHDGLKAFLGSWVRIREQLPAASIQPANEHNQAAATRRRHLPQKVCGIAISSLLLLWTVRAKEDFRRQETIRHQELLFTDGDQFLAPGQRMPEGHMAQFVGHRCLKLFCRKLQRPFGRYQLEAAPLGARACNEVNVA